MLKEKIRLIKQNGVPVEIIPPLAVGGATSLALIGRASKPFNNILSLEHHRRIHFLPDVIVKNGYTILDKSTNDYYLVIAVFREILEQQKATLVSHALACNSFLTVKGYVKTADEDGNITNEAVVKYTNLPVHIRGNNFDLREVDAGLLAQGEYLVYAPGLTIDVLDTLDVAVGNRAFSFKIISVDYITFPDIVIIKVRTETRG